MIAANYRLHLFLLALLLAGTVLLVWSPLPDTITLCLFKNATGTPCPTCGTGHGVQSLLKGDVAGAFQQNPISIVVLPAAAFLLLLIVHDLFQKENRLQVFLLHIKKLLHRGSILTWILICMMVLNWLWLLIQ